jgi:ubiquinone/menaquinone biosynthesis C-methylase UbiE
VERVRRDGAGATAAHVARRAATLGAQQLEDLRLEIEQARGVLGPAHRAWSGNSSNENRERWTGWDWSQAGEEWTASREWKDALVDEVMLPAMPEGGVILEIGPGGGRWSEILAAHAQRLVLVDVTPKALELCLERLRDRSNVEYVLSTGADLPGVADESVDAVWSFDVFVHIAPLDQARYLREIGRVLRPGGVALIHHAHRRNRGALPSRHGWRAPMSARLFASLASPNGLRAERHIRSWSDGRFGLGAYGDVITVLRKRS